MIESRRPFLVLIVLIACTFTGGTVKAQQRPLRDKHDYRPVRADFWESVERSIQNGQTGAVFKMAPPEQKSGPETDEWKLGIAKALVASGHPLHAQYLLMTVAMKSVGTRQGFEALRLLHRIAKDDAIDETAMEELAFDLDTKIDEPESRSMIAYFKAKALLRRGYTEWAEKALAEIVPGTTYAEELEFDRTLQILNSGDTPAAYAKFESLTKSPAARRSTVLLSRLALARLIFERRDYRGAIGTYLKIELPTRERARTLNELAWSYYYDRAYGKALGTIRAIKSAYFDRLLSPETFLVEMLIYRELCHFKTVKAIVKEFQEFYKPVFQAIEDRKPLENIPQIQQMILQEGNFQKRALAIQSIRTERRALEAVSWAADEFKEELIDLAAKRERLIDAEITRMMRTRIDDIANWFLDLREQALYLDYEASMRMIQLNEDQKETYVPRKADPLKSSVLFWPVTSESWLDELLDYEVLVQDQCRQGMPRRVGPGAPRRRGD